MASKRDQLHAYQFLVQRVISALVTRESDPEQPPFRRPGTSAFAGIAVAVIALAAVGVYGMIVPGGNKTWQDGNSIVVEEETGTRFVYLDGRLHPVTNYASALLALGKHADAKGVSRDSLVGVPRGPRIGIPDAPDALPGPDRVLGGGWTLCSQPGADLTGATVHESVLMVGQEPASGIPLGERGLLVDVPETGDQHLVRNGYRHRIIQADAAAVGLALRSAPVMRVSPAVVDVLPVGKPIAPIPVPEAGKPSQAVPGRTDIKVGQLLVVETSGGGVQHYLAETERLRPITELQYDIQRAYKPTAAAYDGGQPVGVVLGLIAASEATKAVTPPAADGDAPAARPAFVAATTTAAAVCLTFAPDSAVPRLVLDPAMPSVDPMTSTPRKTEGGVALADRVLVPPGWVAVVEVMPSPDTPVGTMSVVTDLGRGYSLADPDVLGVLGYSGVRPVRVPAGLMARVPQGNGLSHQAAMRR
ncbi:type VII secretion protein EccB [Actinokineospora sp.]|uniref:type VII secretion protein EccB n=1 Tax=Actinokineospora sp. TaxID=1872133 RepID=UPI0040379958